MRPVAQRSRVGRRVVTSLAIVAAVALGYQLFGGRDEQIATTDGEEERGYYAIDATLTEMGADGRPRTVLRAARVEQQLSDQSVLLTDLVADYNTPDEGTWTLTADRGRLLSNATSLLLSGDVVIRGEQARGTAVIRTDELSYDTTTSVVQTAERVTLQFGQHLLEGRGLRAALKEGTLKLESNVHGRFTP
jgi:lipopolysaccharide export system protein LptC